MVWSSDKLFNFAVISSVKSTSAFYNYALIITSMLDLLAVGQKFTWSAYRALAAAVDRYPAARAGPQQQTHQLPLLLGQTDRQTDIGPFDDA